MIARFSSKVHSLPGRLACVLASGLMLPLMYPPIGIWPIGLVVLPLLLFATSESTPRIAFYLGALHGMVGFGMALFWLFDLFGVSAFGLLAILSSFTALTGVFTSLIAHRFANGFWRATLIATFWTAIEFFRSELFTLRFPWITPGTALGPTALSPILGVYGMTFLTVLTAAFLVQRRTLTIAIPFVIAILALGTFRPGRVEPHPERAIDVALIQAEDGTLSTYQALTTEAFRNARADLVVWPEYALPYDVRRDRDAFAELSEVSESESVVLVLGTKTIPPDAPERWRNTALTLEGDAVLGEYHKARTVHFFNDGTPGETFTPIVTSLGVMGTPICFDCDYTAVIRSMVDEGAEFLAAPSYHAAHWPPIERIQSAAHIRLRAAESARWIVVAASSGVSQIVDPHGNVHTSLPPMEEGFLSGRISASTEATFFTRWGWLFPWLSVVVAIVVVMGTLIRDIMARFVGIRRSTDSSE